MAEILFSPCLSFLRPVARLLLRRGTQRNKVRHRFAAKGIQHGSAGREAVGDPDCLAILLESSASFAAADVDLQASVFHPLKLCDERLGAVLEPRVFEHT